MAMTAYGIPLALVASFKYLGRFLSKTDGDWPEVVHNLWRARHKWEQPARVLIREGTDARNLGNIYVAVVQAVMLYGSDTWVMTLRVGWVLCVFHHRVACRLTGRQPRIGQDGGWMYTSLKDMMVESVLLEVETYVSCHQNSVAQFIKTRTIMHLRLAPERRPGLRVANRWWDQDVLDLEGMQTAAWGTEWTEGGGGGQIKIRIK